MTRFRGEAVRGKYVIGVETVEAPNSAVAEELLMKIFKGIWAPSTFKLQVSAVEGVLCAK